MLKNTVLMSDTHTRLPVRRGTMAHTPLNSIRALTIFRSLYETSSATRTAEALGITQSGVSRALANLEENLGLILFHRDRSRLQATPEASELYESTLRLLKDADDLAQTAATLREFGASRLRIASIPGLAFGYLPRAIAALHEEHPRLSVNYDVMSTGEVLRAIESDQADIGFVTLPVKADGLRIEEIVTTEAVCLVPRRNRLARRDRIELEDLSGEHLVVANQPNVAADRLLQLVRDRGIRLAGTTESNLSAVCALVGSGVGVSVINPITARDLGDRHSVALPFQPAIHYSFGMLCKTHWADSKPVASLRRILRGSAGNGYQ